MTIKNLYMMCGNINFNTKFEIYKNGQIISDKTFNCTPYRLVETEIKQFDIDFEKNVVVIYF